MLCTFGCSALVTPKLQSENKQWHKKAGRPVNVTRVERGDVTRRERSATPTGRSLLFPSVSCRGETSGAASPACKHPPAGSDRASHMASAHFRSHTQKPFPGATMMPRTEIQETCNPRGHVTALSHTVFTTDSDRALCCTPWLCLHAAAS